MQRDHGRSGRVAAGLLALLATLALAAPAQARSHTRGPWRSHTRGPAFLAGAGRADLTPPAAGSAAGAEADAAFAASFAGCPAAAFPSRGRFALQEPFNDLNGTGAWDAGTDLGKGPNGRKPDPWCDTNANGRWDGIHADNGFGPVTGVHDPIEARAVAISDGRHHPVVYASASVIGLFDVYTDLVRYDLRHRYHVDADLVVSANHNESSPDTIGLYGDLQTPLGVGVRSGIDEYYMDFLADRVARAAADAVRAMRPADLYANSVSGPIPDGQSGGSYPLLRSMSIRISDQFPTSVALPADDRLAAADPKMGVLQARGADGRPIFTVINLAAHNQEMGNAGAGISGDWPGAMQRAFDAAHPGMAMFLVGANGSMEDPQTEPPAVPRGSENHSDQATQWIQAQATGRSFAQLAGGAAAGAVRLAHGAVRLHRRAFCVPLENNGFAALAAAGEFGRRQAWACDPSSGAPLAAIPNGAVLPTAGASFRTFVAYTDIGPDLQLLDFPGEAFPALALGSPFGADEASCPRPNPAVPNWHARGLFRFRVGLADDLIGYLIPPWGFASGTPGLFNNDACYQDQHGHGHKLESESVGPTGSGAVADRLSALLAAHPDPSARIVGGRYLRADGSASRWPTAAVGVEITPAGATRLDPGHDTLIGSPATRGFGSRSVSRRGVWMDFDGQPQSRPDVNTRGIMVLDAHGCVSARYYLDVFPTLPASGSGGAGSAQQGDPVPPTARCDRLVSRSGVPELQPSAAAAAGL